MVMSSAAAKKSLGSSSYHNPFWQVIEKLYREKWSQEDGVGCIILSPTNDLAGQIWEVVRKVGKHHNFSGGAIVKRTGIEQEKERINSLNILVCTPGRLVQHFDETPNFDCSNLQVIRHNLIYGYFKFQMMRCR